MSIEAVIDDLVDVLIAECPSELAEDLNRGPFLGRITAICAELGYVIETHSCHDIRVFEIVAARNRDLVAPIDLLHSELARERARRR